MSRTLLYLTTSWYWRCDRYNLQYIGRERTSVLTQLYTESNFKFLIILCSLCALKAYLNVIPLLNAKYRALAFCHLVYIIIYL